MSIPDEHTPNWQPISFLPNIAWMINGMLESAQDVHGSLQQARLRPHVMDDCLQRPVNARISSV